MDFQLVAQFLVFMGIAKYHPHRIVHQTLHHRGLGHIPLFHQSRLDFIGWVVRAIAKIVLKDARRGGGFLVNNELAATIRHDFYWRWTKYFRWKFEPWISMKKNP